MPVRYGTTHPTRPPIEAYPSPIRTAISRIRRCATKVSFTGEAATCFRSTSASNSGVSSSRRRTTTASTVSGMATRNGIRQPHASIVSGDTERPMTAAVRAPEAPPRPTPRLTTDASPARRDFGADSST
jgi:hypothetical protein